MPNGVRVVLIYGFALLALLSLTLPLVLEQAVEAPVSPLGMLWMLLLAYVIFTLTLILQRKQAARLLSIGLATLSLPLIPLLFLWAGLPGALSGVALSCLLLLSLRSRAARGWFVEQ